MTNRRIIHKKNSYFLKSYLCFEISIDFFIQTYQNIKININFTGF